MQQQREPSASESFFWPSVWAIALHVLVFGMLFVSFAMTPDLPPAKPIVQATLYQLKSKVRPPPKPIRRLRVRPRSRLRARLKSNRWNRRRSSRKR